MKNTRILRSLSMVAAVLSLLKPGFTLAAERKDAMPCPSEFFFGDYNHAAVVEKRGELARMVNVQLEGRRADVAATPEKRREFARMLLARISRLDAVVPELSPSERAWLAGELRQSGPRNIAASGSVEYQKFTVRDFIHRNSSLLNGLVGGGRIALHDEVTLWARVAQNYENYEYARAIAALVAAQIIGPEFTWTPKGLDAGDALDFLCRNQARQISSIIVVPYLTGDLRK